MIMKFFVKKKCRVLVSDQCKKNGNQLPFRNGLITRYTVRSVLSAAVKSAIIK